MIDIEALKRDWRRKAALHGVNVLEGVTVYTEANMKAQAAKECHYERMALLVYEHAYKHPLKFPNGAGWVDLEKVERKARRDWWVYSWYWKQGPSYHPTRMTERLACMNVETEALQRMFAANPVRVLHIVPRSQLSRRGILWRNGMNVTQNVMQSIK